MSLFAKWRDSSLTDVSDEALRQITKLLYMDTADYFGDRARIWLVKQEQHIKGLDVTLLRPRDLFARLALSMSRRSFPFCAEGPRLCPTHKALDHRVIRNMLQLVADECTIQTNRYRSLRLKKMLHPSLEGWMDRMDSITALWLGEDKFQRVFGSRLRGSMPDCVKTKCEACMLAVLGGSAMHLTDLRASVLARQAYNTKLTGREHRRPRLLRIVNSWISFFQEDCRKAICECSEGMVNEIVDMRTLARQRRDKEDERRKKKGKPPRPRSNARVRLTKEGLPIPRQPRLRKGDTERLVRRVEKRMETLLSLQETVVEQQEKESEGFRWPVSDEAIDPTKTKSAILLAQGNDDIETIAWSEPEKGKQSDYWGNRPSDEDIYEKDDGRAQFWVQDDHQPIVDDAPRKNASAQSRSKLRFSANTPRLAEDTDMTSNWTSKVDDESPRTAQVPLLCCDEEILSLGETASSVYSCDERVETRTKARTLEEALSVISGFTRDSMAPMSLRWTDADRDAAKRDRGRGESHRTVLAMLGGREAEVEEEAASCYETMGWGGPGR